MNSIVMKCGYASWNNLFNSEELEQIDEYVLKNIEPKSSYVGTGSSSKENKEYRDSTIYWIKLNPDTQWIFDRVNSAALKLNSHFFGFDINSVDTLQYTVYNEESGHYDWHWDMFFESGLSDLTVNIQRKLSLVVVCKRSEEGGQLELIIGSNSCTIPNSETGSAIVFPSFTMHRVTPVTKGVRKTLVAWLPGPDWR